MSVPKAELEIWVNAFEHLLTPIPTTRHERKIASRWYPIFKKEQ